MRLLIRIAANALGLWLCTVIVPGISLVEKEAGKSSTETVVLYFLIGGAVLGAVNFLVRPILVFLSIPFYILTLGLFFLIVNAAMLMLATSLTEHLDIHVAVTSFGVAILGGIVLSLCNIATNALLPEEYKR